MRSLMAEPAGLVIYPYPNMFHCSVLYAATMTVEPNNAQRPATTCIGRTVAFGSEVRSECQAIAGDPRLSAVSQMIIEFVRLGSYKRSTSDTGSPKFYLDGQRSRKRAADVS